MAELKPEIKTLIYVSILFRIEWAGWEVWIGGVGVGVI